MIAIFPRALVTETQSALLTALGIGSQAAITSISVTNIPDAKTTIHSARSYVRDLGECRHPSIFLLSLTTAITDTWPWRDPSRERSDQAWSMTRVGVQWIALYGLLCFVWGEK